MFWKPKPAPPRIFYSSGTSYNASSSRFTAPVHFVWTDITGPKPTFWERVRRWFR